MIHVEEAIHPKSSKNSCENVSIVFFSSWLPFRSLGSMASKFFRVSSPDPPAQLGLVGAKGVSLCRSVSWIVRLEESSEVRGESFDVVFPLDFGRSDFWSWKRR